MRKPDGRWTTRGLDVTTNYGVHFDPFDSKHIFIGYTDIGAFHSYDGGQSWESATEGVPGALAEHNLLARVRPQGTKGRVWGAFSGVHDLPRPKMWRGRDPQRLCGRRRRFGDGGHSWSISNAGHAGDRRDPSPA